MNGKSVFFLCLIIAIIFFALGFSSGYWFLMKWISLGMVLLKYSIWVIGISTGLLILWLMFRKDRKDGN